MGERPPLVLIDGKNGEVLKMSDRRDVLKPFEEKRSYWEDRVKTGIEANRKGFAFLKFVDEKDAPVTGVQVKITQKNHDFRYGTNLFMLDGFDTPEENAAYRKLYAENFNIATIPFYWKDLEPEQGKPRYTADSPFLYRRPAPDPCVKFCLENGIEPKAHCLNYESFTPQWAYGAGGNVAKEKLLLEKRFRELAERYSADIPSWEVTNETFWGLNRGKLALYDSPDFVEWSFKLAEQYFPANKLIINEEQGWVWHPRFYGFRSPYFMQIERALLKGARIDAIGMQYHMFFGAAREAEETRSFYDPERLYNVLDTYGSFGLPLQITEMTIPAYDYTENDEAVQAEIIRNLYSIWFSHPAMDAVIYWNLVDGYTYGKKKDLHDGENCFRGGLLRMDFTPKPAFKVIQELFGKTWRTNLDVNSGASDTVSFKGFYGEYELEITAPDGKTSRRTIHHTQKFANTIKIKL